MVKKRVLLGVIASCFCIGFLLSSYEEEEEEEYARSIDSFTTYKDYMTLMNYSDAAVTIQDAINQQKDLLRKELKDYPFPGQKQLENFTLAAGGQPVRNIIITTWRSGSTFLGDILNALPGNFYHYEPLLDYGIVQIRGPPFQDSAVGNLKSLLKCDYKNLESYLDYGRHHVYLFTHNTRLWVQCETYPQYCWNSTFLTETCKQFPFQSMKIVRLRLKLVEELLEDEMLSNVKVVLLIRDPRGTIQSRKHRDWCPGEPDCDQPSYLCNDMVSDYEASIRLQNSYPTRFRALRYEDLSLNPYRIAKDLFDFFGLYFHPQVTNFLDSHTKLNVGGVSSTFRDSKSAPFHWRHELNYSEVLYIEESCDQAMKLWGYSRVKNESQLRDFNPLTSFTLS